MRKKLLFFSIVFILLWWFFISQFAPHLDRIIFSFYQNSEKKLPPEKLLTIAISESDFIKDEIWPWGRKWPYYLISYLYDQKIKGIIIGPKLINKLNLSGKLNLIYPFLKKKDIYLALDSLNYVKGIDFKGHLQFIDKKIPEIPLEIKVAGKKYLALGLVLANKEGKLKVDNDKNLFYIFKGKKIRLYKKYPLSIARQNFSYFRASSIALKAFLNTFNPNYQNKKLNANWIFLEAENPSVLTEANIISTLLNGRFKIKLPSSFSIFIGFLISFALLIFYLIYPGFIYFSLFFLFFLIIFSFVHFYLFYHGFLWLSYSYVTSLCILSYSEVLLLWYLKKEKTRMKKEEIKQARILKEKEILPPATAKLDGLVLSVARYRMDVIGGDFYQFIEFPQKQLGIIMGWAPGNGLERLNYIKEVVQEWRNNASIYKEPGKVFQVLNNSLFLHAEEAKYATCIYILIDANKMMAKYVNAGHDPLILIDSDRKIIEPLPAKEPTPLGIARDIVFPQQIIHLKAGDVLIAFSGGISEVLGNGPSHLTKVFQSAMKYLHEDPTHLVDDLFHDLLKIGRAQDEWSLLLLKIEGNGKR